MPEDIQSISSSRLTGAELSRHTFTSVRRGLDPHEVRSFLELVARELTSSEQREEDLRARLAEAEERAAHPVLDEATVSSALGQQSAQVLRNAHDEAARITLQAEEAAQSLLREAQRHAAELQVQAESASAERIAEAEIARRALRQAAEEEAAALLEASRTEAEALIARGLEQGQEMVEQAQETRRRVLVDMAQRRRSMTLQIEQFRAARDELAAAVMGLRDSVDAAVSDLARADDSARAAAAEVARFQSLEAPASQILAEVEEAEAALDEAMARAAEEREHPEVVAAVFDVEVEDPATGEVIEEVVEVVEVVAVDEATDDADPVGTEEAGDAVEGLFARIRAGRDEGPRSEEGDGDDAPGATGGQEAGGAAAPVPPGEGGGEAGGPGAEDGGEEEPDAADADPDDPLRARQVEALDPIAAQLAKRVKRALQDDQNRMLDRLRSGSGVWSPDVLPEEDEQRSLYVDAAADGLREAAAAGTAFGRQERGDRRGRPATVDAKTVGALAERLAGSVVSPLRRRLEEDGGADEAGADRIGAAYRDWRGARIERLVGDFALEAFSAGVLAATGTKGGLRWVLAGGEPACADCDDNALAGAVKAGEEFPTGHLHPPAHAGCRCLVAPTPV